MEVKLARTIHKVIPVKNRTTGQTRTMVPIRGLSVKLDSAEKAQNAVFGHVLAKYLLVSRSITF